MQWPGPLVRANLLKRYKRFLADFRLESGEVVTAHCANTGSMVTCLADGAPSLLTLSDDPKRKLRYSWQAIQLADGWVGINTALANALVAEALSLQCIPELRGYPEVLREQRYGHKSRVDFLLRGGTRPDCHLEVKNVTLLLGPGVVGFPDAVTVRGQKHLSELTEVVAQGGRAVLFYCVQRQSAERLAPAEGFDPAYAQALRAAVAAGVEVIAWTTQFSDHELCLSRPIPVTLST